MEIVLLAIGLILFVGLVVVHEYGHFIMARRGGVEVEEFGVGFPPRAKVLAKKRGTVYSLNWLPLGGFVKLKGENDADTAKGTYGAAPLGTKVKIMLAGVVMNLVTAFILLTFVAMIGMPRLIENQYTVESDTRTIRNDVLIGFVEEGSPAATGGLKQRDQLLKVEHESYSKTIENSAELPEVTKELEGREVSITYQRDGQARIAKVQLRGNEEVQASQGSENPKGYLGVSPTEYTIRRSTWSAPIVAAGFIKQVTELTFKGLGTALANLFRGETGKASEQVAGPVGIFVLLKDGSLLGVEFILMIVAIISLTLAIMNALPIPALDGGRLFVTLLFRVIRRPLTKKTEDMIHGTGFAALMLLFVLITIVDVKRFF